METVTLNDGNKLPVLDFGTGSKWKGYDVSQYVEQAIEVGFSHIDTAQFYANEESVGKGIKYSGLPRSDLFITTKYSIGDIWTAVRNSLSKLGVHQLDLYLVHTPSSIAEDFEGAWKKFEEIKEQGLSKSIGVSNFNLEQLQRLVKIARIKPSVNQILFHPYNYTENKELLEYSAKHGIITAAYSSLNPITKTPGGPVDAPVATAAKRLGVSSIQVILAWVRAKGVVIVTTSSTKKHLEEYMAVPEITLNEDEIAAIDEAGAKGPPSSISKVRVWYLCGLIVLACICILFWNLYMCQ